MDKNVFSIQHKGKLSMCSTDLFLSIQHMENFSICCMDNLYIYNKVKDMPDDTKQVHNESIYMTHIRKIYTNIAPIGNIFSFTERQKLSYSVLLGFTPPRNIFITTQCIVLGYSSVFIKPQKSDNSQQNNNSPQIISHLVITKRVLSLRPSRKYLFHFLLSPPKASLIPLIYPIKL